MNDARHAPRAALHAIALSALVLLISLWARAAMPLNHDVAWFLVAAERMLDGGNYLDDFFEVNMPAAIAIHAPMVALHRLTGLELPWSVIACTLLLAVHGLVLLWRVQSPTAGGTLSVSARVATVVWSALLLVALPAYEFAEREHLMLLLALPFVALLASPQLGGSPRLQRYVTCVAAVGFYLKPHYAPLPFVLLLAHRLLHRAESTATEDDRARLRMLIALLGVGALYAGWVALAHPGWFEVARWAGALYAEFRDPGWQKFVGTTSLTAALLCCGFLVVVFAIDRGRRATVAPFLLAALYALAVYLLQDKGWRYQLLPALLFAAAGLPGCVAAAGAAAPRISRRLAAIPAAMLALATLATTINAHRETPRIAQFPDSLIGQALSITRPGYRVHAISTTAVPFFPAITHYRLQWASRFSTLWPLAALAAPADPRATDVQRAGQAAFAERFTAMVAEDLARWQPDVILVDLRRAHFGHAGEVDLVGFLARSAAFRDQWQHYRVLGRSRDFEIRVRRQD